jgi:glycosyltransferase involved in cell wall biosynthesis
MMPSLGVVSYAPIQYHTPLWQLITKRGNIKLDVLFLSDNGIAPITNSAFGVPITWDIDLLSGYDYTFLTTKQQATSTARKISTLACWLSGHDAVVVNGYTSPWMLLTMAMCRTRHLPYYLRASSHPQGQSTGLRSYLRPAVTRLVVSESAGGLSMGKLNEEFYLHNRARSIIFAPNSVDDQRFAGRPSLEREDLLAQWGLDCSRPVILFCGKLIQRKRPKDLAAAISRLGEQVSAIFVGDGPLAGELQQSFSPNSVVITGFVNQADIPSYYHAADILVLPSEVETWGMVVNEAMAAGALPVVSDKVGCASDLASDVGQVFRCGDIDDLVGALKRALHALGDPSIRYRVRQHVSRYSLDHTAEGFEQAARAVVSQ